MTVVLRGDRRLEDKLRTPDLRPISIRIRTRLPLRHLLGSAGNEALMTDEPQHTLCEHAAGNRSVLMHLCNELLAVAKNAKQLDESLYFELASANQRPLRAAAPPRAKPARR